MFGFVWDEVKFRNFSLHGVFIILKSAHGCFMLHVLVLANNDGRDSPAMLPNDIMLHPDFVMKRNKLLQMLE